MRLILIAIVLAVSACAEPITDAPVPIDVGDSPTTSSVPPIEVAYRCGPVDLDDPDLVAAFPPFDGDIATMMPEEAQEEFEAGREWWDSLAWRIASETETTMVLLGVDEEEKRLGDVAFEMVDGEWRATGWGDCRIEPVVDGYGVASFELDPTNPPVQTSREVAIMATERNCANGQIPDGREVRTSVAETGDEVRILVLVEPISGGATCPSNPAFPVRVLLTGALVTGSSSMSRPRLSPKKSGRSRSGPVISASIWRERPQPQGQRTCSAGVDPNAGALLVEASNWSEDPTWYQSFTVDVVTITGYVAICDGCQEECESDICDQLERIGPGCSEQYVAQDGLDVDFTILYADGGCSIDVTTNPIAP